MDRKATCSDRRGFLRQSAAALIAAHTAGAKDAAGQTTAGNNRQMDRARILGVELQSAAPLARMKEFYQRSIGLTVVEDRADRLTVSAGESRLTFIPAASDRARPFYHFAFNIPENKIRAARDWQRERTPLLPIPANLRDAAFPNDVVNYSHWNAHSVFFFDPAGNVVEYIARHDLRNSASGGFDPRDLLCLSEIALVVDDVAAMAASLRQVAGVENYRGESEQFAALGDERGLLLVMRRGRVISFDSPERKAVDVFRTAIRVRGPRRAEHRVANFPYDVAVEM
jgi:hypothetical protein